ncbi:MULTISPECIES: tryptophan synthase subunit beta [unclassified Brenneria]|uniref:tryptophan synthase subunit beta n=1 Tax=unclassified Brenneria TaxID=2634434 RepID=UPI0015575185|nr:tryptophan synthase subunit beta [Brenneria sp. hezel4-2-4]MEE3652726.1 tryptophan synthase subunit beta [Brenneria sp. HEZEL_4_2_4]MEE3652859.1 tryptophan synthase subunit beta [Brenneria sp. HEZEL_4_2_4]NPD02682.1 tryptophan synthase subunit beta [Brenneria sp. hezel4-2-4]NPD02813.1 tryptophan synthase subunit beta [Brenneria sp. hezel4-2-4]
MFYIQRDGDGHLLKVDESPFPEMNGELPAGSTEALEWFKTHDSATASLQQLRQSDLEMVRVLEDLIQVLINKGVISITDFPSAAQLKLIGRAQAREALNSGLDKLIGDDEDGMF